MATATVAEPEVTCQCGCGRTFRFGKMFGSTCVVRLRAIQIATLETRARRPVDPPPAPPPAPVVEAKPPAAEPEPAPATVAASDSPYVYICSPFRADSAAQRLFNVATAKAMCELAVRQGFIPIAPHLFYPEFLDDEVPEQRERGLAAGLVFLPHCRELWYLDHGTSEGMKREMAAALVLGIACRPVQLLRTGPRDFEPVLMDQIGDPA